MIRRFSAELLGTFTLAFLVHLSIGSEFPLATPVVAGLTVLFLVYILGPISGAHLNPSVTIGLASIGKISAKDALFYLIAQLLGGFLALVAGAAFLGSPLAVTAENTVIIAIAEAIGAAILVLSVTSVVYGKTPKEASGLSIGTALIVGVLAASVQSNGVLNPAVALGIGSLSLAYIVGPIAGGIIAAWSYKGLAE